MITVAGFNTAIDRCIELDSPLRPGVVQRAKSGRAVPGGKGLHVAQMVAEFGEPVRLIGLTDCIHGALIAQYLRERRVEWHGVETPFELRQCLTFSDPTGNTTEVLEPSRQIDRELQESLLETLLHALEGARVLVLSGSLPAGFPPDTYAVLIREAVRRKVHCLADVSGEALRMAVHAGPWLIKPNEEEAAALAGKPVDGPDAAAEFARQLHTGGVANPVVTLGAGGAVAFDGRTFWHARSGPCDVRNPVGSGDCFLGAMAVGVGRGEPLEVSLKRAVAAGAANAESDETGFADAASVHAWMPRVRVERLSPPVARRGCAEGPSE